MHHPERFLPLTEAVYHILLALSDGARHGYGILQEVSRRTDGAVALRTGTMYTAIKRLLEQGLLQETEERPDPEYDDERRRYYRLTELGGAVVTAEARRLRAMVELAVDKAVLGEGSSS